MILQWLVLLYVLHYCQALDNGAADLPPMGWSSWDTFGFNISSNVIIETAHALINTGLLESGYNFVLIDDGWTACLKYNKDGSCNIPAPRNANGEIVVDENKFPGGFEPLTATLHGLGFKVGIYTAVSHTTCGGYVGSLDYEATDANSFVQWGFDFVKQDTCNQDCPITNGCIQNSTQRMERALNATGKPVVIYIDDGNDSTDERMYNPNGVHVRVNPPLKMALSWPQLAWQWAPARANMWKSWFDRADNWESFLDNVHRQAGLAIYQSRGAYNTPDFLTVGEGGQSMQEYEAQMQVYSVLGCPLVLGADVRGLAPALLALLRHPGLLRVAQDPATVQASLLRSNGPCDLWGKPLSDNTFAIVMLNKGHHDATCEVFIGAQSWCCECNKGNCNGGDFYPAQFSTARVRDIYSGEELGEHTHYFRSTLRPHQARMFNFEPIATTTTGSTFLE